MRDTIRVSRFAAKIGRPVGASVLGPPGVLMQAIIQHFFHLEMKKN